MTTAWALYVLVTSALLAAAGWAAERVVADLGRSRRWSWAAAVVGAGLIAPALPVMLELTLSSGAATEQGWMAAPAGAGEAAVALATAEAVRTGQRVLEAAEPWISAAWATSTAVYLGRLASTWLRLRLGTRTEREGDGFEIRRTRSAGPAVLGWRRPLILLPDWVDELDEADRATVLTHEREHALAGDHRLLMTAAVVLGTAPWNPALRWAVRRLRQAVEIDCDRRVVARGIDPARYARLLMGSARRDARSGLPWAAASASGSALGRRVRCLLRPRPRPGRVRVAAVGLAGVLAVTAAGVAATGFRSTGAVDGVVGAARPTSRGAPTPLAAALSCRRGPSGSVTTGADATVAFRRASASDRTTFLVREQPGLGGGRRGEEVAVRVDLSTGDCTASGRAPTLRVHPGSPEGHVRVGVTGGALLRVVDLDTGDEVFVSTRTAGRTAVLCRFGPRDELTCRRASGRPA